MKRLFLAGMLLPWLCFAFAQTQSLPQQLQNLYAPLDKSQVQTGYLINLGVPLADPLRYRGVLNDSNYTDINTFAMLYGELRSGWTQAGNGLPSPSVYLSKIKKLRAGDTIPVAILAMRYDQIRKGAYDLNLLSYNGTQVHDVPGRTQSPYLQDTLFALAPLTGSVSRLDPVFSLPSDLWFSNLSGATPTISLDLGDGLGWRNISHGQVLQAQYPDAGVKEIQIRLQYPGFVRYAHTKLTVEQGAVGERSGGIKWPQELHEVINVTASTPFLGVSGTATVHIFYNTSNCNSTHRMLRPLIIVEGYEEPGFAAASYTKMFDILNNTEWSNNTDNLTDYLHPAEYDLVYIDFTDGSDFIQRNAFVVEEVIKKVNEMKAAAGSTEQNVLIGVSMGGVCSKYALLDMQNTVGVNHDCRLFITYDSPLRGANIPIGVQCLAKFAVDNFGNDVPIINSVIEAINAPTPRQLLLYHLDGINGTAEPVNPTQAAFLTELDGMGALAIRHVALSNGAANGTFVQNEIGPGELLFQLNATKENHCQEAGPIIVCGLLTVGVALRATGENAVTKVMYANALLHLDGNIIVGVESEVNCFTKPYDVSPGGNSNIGIGALTLEPTAGGLGTGLIQAGFSIEGTSHLYMKHHCFIPTFSSVSNTEPATMRSAVFCGTPTLCSNPTVPVISRYSGSAELNQEHIFLDARIALLLIDELVTQAPPLPIHPLALSGTLNTYFNVGLPIYSPIPTITISTVYGQLSVNNNGKVAFATGNDPNSPQNLLIADTKCNAIITVENGAKLVVGADGGVKHGVLNVNEGSIVHIKSGGILYVTSNSSHLVIKHGAKLILDPGAIVRLESPGSSITINGDLVVNGDIIFGGPGFFGFGDGNRLVFGPGYNTFNLAGMGKDQRFVQLGANVEIDNGHRLNWSNGRVEVGAGLFHLSDEAGLDFTNMTLNGGGDFAIEANGSGPITLQSCTVEHLAQPIVGVGGAGCNIFDCAFSNIGFIGVDWTNALTVRVKNSVFTSSNSSSMALNMVDVPFVLLDYSQFSGYGTLLSGIMSDGDLEQAIPAVNLSNTVACMVKGCTFNTNAIGIKGADPNNPGVTANVLAFGGSSFSQNSAGIFVEGTQTTGTVLADCVTFDRNTNGIRGRDIALMIDSENSKIFQFDTDSPNMFINDGFQQAWEAHVRVCYVLKAVGGSNQMRNNAWRINNGGILMEDLDRAGKIFLEKNNCDDRIDPEFEPVCPRNPVCILDQRPASFETPFPGSECMLAVGDEGTTNPVLVHEQFHLGAFLMKADSVEEGIEALRPVAALWQPEMSSFPDNCQQYIRVAKAFVDASDQNLPNLQRPNVERANTQNTDNLLIAPNPANNSALLQLSPAESQLTVWNPQGKRCFQAAASGAYRLETATWLPGIYFIEAVSADGRRKSGKLVVQR